MKGPVDALTPSQGGRGRSRILHGDHKRGQRTKSPSVRELKKHISRPVTMPSQTDLFLERSPVEMSSAHPKPLFINKRRSNSPHITVRRLQEIEAPATLPEAFPSNEGQPERGGFESYTDSSRPSRLAHRRGFSESHSSRRSGSLGRAREPSPLRNVILSREQAQTVDSLQIPTGIPEEDIVSPRKLPSELNLTFSARPRSEPSTPSVERHDTMLATPPHYNKELPVLPSYLVPQPLFVRSESSDMEAALQALHEQYRQPGRAEFASWRAELDIPLPESPDSETDAVGSDSHSPTFSSIKGGTSGVCTPHRLSELPDWPLRAAFARASVDFNLDNGVSNLSNHARTVSTTSSTVPYSLPPGFDGNPFAEKRIEGQDMGPRSMTQMEQLLDEFDYLGAALI
jgi:hypothetical protein